MGLTSPDVRCGQFTLPEPGRGQEVPRPAPPSPRRCRAPAAGPPLALRLLGSGRIFPDGTAELVYAVARG